MLDLLGRYRWRNIEGQVSLLNLSNPDWREVRFDDRSGVASELGSMSLKGGGRMSSGDHDGDTSNAGAEAIHLTPGNPFWVRGGLTISCSSST